MKKNPIFNINVKAATIIASSLLVMSNEKTAAENMSYPFEGSPIFQRIQKRILKPKLVLKLNLYDPARSLLVSHGSHSSHSSHASHSSHSSGGFSNGDSDGGGGAVIIGLLAAGAAGYGLYKWGKNTGNKK